jgi:hypothetical protein
MSELLLLGDIELPTFFDYQNLSKEEIEKLRDKQYGFLYIVTHVRHKPQFINYNEYCYTNNIGVGWFISLIIAINQALPKEREIMVEKLLKEHKGKDLSITYPENYCTIEQQRHLKEILALIKPNKVKILTNSPFVIQTCGHNELAIAKDKDDIDWAKFKDEQIEWLKLMNKK